MKRKNTIVVLGLFIFVFMLLNESQTITSYVDEIRYSKGNGWEEIASFTWNEMSKRSNSSEDDQLLGRIKKEAEKLKEAPKNAVIDPVWKAIPGYNGLEVDITKTFRLAKFSKDNSVIPYVFNEIKPTVHLDDLAPNPIYKGNPKKPMVSLMINVAWGDEYLPSMLKTLRDENVKATFFFDGSWLSKHVETARKIVNQGHEVSNHAYSHKNMSELSDAAAKEEIVKTERLLAKQLGVSNQLFAPPSGDFDADTVRIAHDLKLKTILWTIDTVDWKKPEPSWIVRKISSRLEPGALILMHPTDSSSKALPGIIKEIKNNRLAIGTVSELISSDRVRPPVETSFHF